MTGNEDFKYHFGEVNVPPDPELITIWPPGATAKLGDIEVRILGAQIRKGEVLYEVAWVIDGSRKEAWVHGFELSEGSSEQRVGFRPVKWGDS